MRLLYIPFDHLHRDYGILKSADLKNDVIVFVQSERMCDPARWNPIRLYFLISSARHFAEALRAEGFTVHYLTAATTVEGLRSAKQATGITDIYSAQPSSFKSEKMLREAGVMFIPNDFFLTPRELFQNWASTQKSFLMENFYRKQRERLNVLMDGKQPTGGQWNFDKSNRLPPPKNYQWPGYFTHDPDEIDREVAQNLGINPAPEWATDRKGALAQMNYFFQVHFAGFGPYEDAMTSENWALHHSLLSPYINNGLLHPAEVVEAARVRFEQGGIPIESCEAFVRQIIGWREYINGMYWFLGADYRENNQLSAQRPLLPLFEDSTRTAMNCMRTTVEGIRDRAWVHHIPRLMLLSNLALVTGTNPQEFLDWMRREFIDASEWVMVPNVIGMGAHADGGVMMTKPYAAGGAHISRMSNYCKPCKYDPKLRIGESACPFTTLYWDFLDRNRERFNNNHRMAQQYGGLDRLNDLAKVKVRAQEVLEGLTAGTI
ncbi:MAG: cryptochrome/photolyase family protein [Actinomycetes bacterium]